MGCAGFDAVKSDWFNRDWGMCRILAVGSTLERLTGCTRFNGQRVYALAHQLGKRIINEAVSSQSRHAAETSAHHLNTEVPPLFGTRMACVQMAVVLHEQLSWLQRLLQAILDERRSDGHDGLTAVSCASGNTCLLM